MTENLIVDYLKREGFPVTESNYLAIAYPDAETYTPEMIEEWRAVEQDLND